MSDANRIIALEAMIASLVRDIQTADKLLSRGDDVAALSHIRWAATKSDSNYLEYVGRQAIKVAR